MVRHNFELSFVLRFGYILRNAALFLFFNHHFLITLFAAGHGRHYPQFYSPHLSRFQGWKLDSEIVMNNLQYVTPR